jgi:hypothetical protein
MDKYAKVNNFHPHFKNNINKNKYASYSNLSNRIENNEEKILPTNRYIFNNIDNNNDNKNKFYNSCIISKTYSLYAGNEEKKKKLYYDEINKNQRDNNDNINFISELRKMSNSHEKRMKEFIIRRNNSSLMYQSQSYKEIPPFWINENKKNNQNYQNDLNTNNNNLNQDNSINKNNEKVNDSIINYNVLTNYENISKTVNRNYDNKINNIGSVANYSYNSLDNKQFDPQNINKYLKNPNYKNKKIRTNSIEDLSNKVINNKSYHFSPGKENENNMNINSNNNINYEKPNTERTTCHYFYESKQQSNNDNIINRNKNDININKY